VNVVARRNVVRAIEMALRQSRMLCGLVRDGRITIVGAMYDVVTGDIEFLPATCDTPDPI
jgi:carbonic anhydrase